MAEHKTEGTYGDATFPVDQQLAYALTKFLEEIRPRAFASESDELLKDSDPLFRTWGHVGFLDTGYVSKLLTEYLAAGKDAEPGTSTSVQPGKKMRANDLRKFNVYQVRMIFQAAIAVCSVIVPRSTRN